MHVQLDEAAAAEMMSDCLLLMALDNFDVDDRDEILAFEDFLAQVQKGGRLDALGPWTFSGCRAIRAPRIPAGCAH